MNQQKLESLIDERSRLVGNQRREIIALQTEVETIRYQVDEVANNVKEAESCSTREWVELRDAAMARSRTELTAAQRPRHHGGLEHGSSRICILNRSPFEKTRSYRNGESHKKGGINVALAEAAK